MKNQLSLKENKLATKENPNANLEVVTGPEEGAQYQLLGNEITIGRESSNDISLEDNQASRLHAVISRENQRYYIKDLNSQNGTLVNNKPVTFTELSNGDKITIGETSFDFYIEEYQKGDSDTYDDLGRISPRKSKFRLVATLVIAIGVLYWINSSPIKDNKKSEPEREPLSIPPTNLTEAPIFGPEEKKIQNTNIVTAENLYQRGFRELMARNYLRAIHFFEASLTLYPDHKSAKNKLVRTHEEITKEIDSAFLLGRRYFENHQWRRSIYYFERAKLLLDKNRDSHTYLEAERLSQEARERLNPPRITALEVE